MMKKVVLLAAFLNDAVALAQPARFDTIIHGRNKYILQVPAIKPGYQYVDRMPEAPYDIKTFLSRHTWYPKDAEKEGIEGRVVVQFVVTKDGSIDSPTVRKSVYPSLDSEALRLICAMPPWKPGTLNGRPVRVLYTLPVTFRLE